MSDEHLLARDFISELDSDVALARQAIESNDSPAARRTYVRAVFAAVEGAANHLKLEVLGEETDVDLSRMFSRAEIAALRDEAYTVNDKGEACVQTRFVRTDDNLFFAVRMYFREYGIPIQFDRSGSGWQAFKRALSTRHRITHPRRSADIDVGDAELDDIKHAHHWFEQMFTANYELALAKLRQRRIELEARKHATDNQNDQEQS